MSERTIAVTFGRWGGVYAHGCRWLWRICFGWVAVTYFNGEFTQAMRLWMMYEPKNGGGYVSAGAAGRAPQPEEARS